MNYFFGIKSEIFNCLLTIPKFSNKNSLDLKYKLFSLKIKKNLWEINRIKNNEDNFYRISDLDFGHTFFFIASENEIKNFFNSNELYNYNTVTDTEPAFRANLKIFIKNGGFSSYQSEYPFGMVMGKGNIISPIFPLNQKNANNYLYFANIYYKPIHKKFHLHFIDYKKKIIVCSKVVFTNKVNEIKIDNNLINKNIYIVSDQFLGIPVFVNEKNKFLSCEHTHPPHEYIISSDKNLKVKQLKNEFIKIINKKNLE